MTNYESMVNAIEIPWQSAHKSPTQHDWCFRWDSMYDWICGLQSGLIWFGDREQFEEVNEDLVFLRKIAERLRCMSL